MPELDSLNKHNKLIVLNEVGTHLYNFYLVSTKYYTFTKFYTGEIADVDRIIFDNFDDNLLITLYRSNKYINSILNETFWMQRFIKQHGSRVTDKEARHKTHYYWYLIYRDYLSGYNNHINASIMYDHLEIFKHHLHSETNILGRKINYGFYELINFIKKSIEYKSLNIYKYLLQQLILKDFIYLNYQAMKLCDNGIEWLKCFDFIDDFKWNTIFTSRFFDENLMSLCKRGEYSILEYLFSKVGTSENQIC